MSGPAEPDRLRSHVRHWLAANWRPGEDRHDWLVRVVDAGYAVPRWPEQWGGLGLGDELADVVVSEFDEVGAVGAGQDRTNLWAGTVMAHGSADLKARFLRPMLTAELGLCLLYSEPNAGSDLAAVQTRADPDGDEWVVSGQKVWTSNAHDAAYGFLLARTDWGVPKHRGLTFFIFPMRQPGVEVRPIRQITGESEFNEVFIDGARVPGTHIVGGLNDGWAVLQTALAIERAWMSDRDRRERRAARARGERRSALGRRGNVDLVSLACDLRKASDQTLRQDIARIYTWQRLQTWNQARAAAEGRQGRPPRVGALAKLSMSRLEHQRAKVLTRLLGPEAMLDGPAASLAELANFRALNAYFTSIGGGTDEIQRNIVGERVLGLPKEPDVDKNLPFRDVLKSSSTWGRP